MLFHFSYAPLNFDNVTDLHSSSHPTEKNLRGRKKQTKTNTHTHTHTHTYIYTISIYPVLPGHIGGSCFSVVVVLVVVLVVVALVSQWWWSVSPRVFLAKITFLVFSHYHGNHFAKFLAHVLSWVKTYHAKFQRNPPTSWPE